MTDPTPDALLRLADIWEQAASDWYYEHRYDPSQGLYAQGFEDGWLCAANLLRQYVNGGTA